MSALSFIGKREKQEQDEKPRMMGVSGATVFIARALVRSCPDNGCGLTLDTTSEKFQSAIRGAQEANLISNKNAKALMEGRIDDQAKIRSIFQRVVDHSPYSDDAKAEQRELISQIKNGPAAKP